MALLDTPPAAPERELALAPYALDAALALERALGIGHVLSQVLVRRGLADPVAARAFLAADTRHDPSGFAGIDRALASVRAAIASGRRITVHGDYDVDGVCATAIMVRALRSLGAQTDWFLPGRLQDGYGLSAATVRRLAARGTGLILTVDCAITAVEEVDLARELGLEVVVTDHHAPRPDGRLPDCPIVHPAVGGYPCPDLCGTGVAAKLAAALGAPTAPEEAELVALATVADLVPLTGENRRLVREGLRALAITARPGLRALMAVAKVDPGALDAGTLGFRLAPRINAAGRLTRADAGLELLLCEDPGRASQIAAELDAVNAERRAVEQRILWEAETQIRERAQELGGSPPSAYVLAGEGWHPGVVGIVASRIVEAHHRPAVLIAFGGEGCTSGTGIGSARSIPGFDLLGGLHAAAGHLGRYGGHRAAAGLSLAIDALEGFRISFEAHAAEMLTPEMLVPVERADAVVSGSELGLALAEELERLEPCGIGNPAPRLLVPGARFADVAPMGEGRHARFSVISGGVRAKAVAFGCEGRVAPETHDATFRLERNVWNGAVEPRLVLRHAERCAAAPIERLGAERPYLAAVLAALEAAPGAAHAPSGERWPAGPGRTVLDRRGESPLAVLADAMSAGRSVLAVCADAPRRLEGLRARTGGFTLTDHGELAAGGASSLDRFEQVVALDPPAGREEHALLCAGRGYLHLAWGPAELRFAAQVHEREYGLRPSLVALYRSLRDRGRAAGAELEDLLRGDGPHGRSPSLAARLIRVLAELELVGLDRERPALVIAPAPAPTALERSPSFRVYAERYEDGRRFLSSANNPPTG